LQRHHSPSACIDHEKLAFKYQGLDPAADRRRTREGGSGYFGLDSALGKIAPWIWNTFSLNSMPATDMSRWYGAPVGGGSLDLRKEAALGSSAFRRALLSSPISWLDHIRALDSLAATTHALLPASITGSQLD